MSNKAGMWQLSLRPGETFGEAVQRYRAVWRDASTDVVNLTSTGFPYGFTAEAVAAGEVKAIISGENAIVEVTASGAITQGKLCYAGAGGKIAQVPDVATRRSVTETPAVTTNQATLANTADFPIAIKATAGTTTGPMVILPRGSTPATGQAALSADGTKVNFATADAVTAATVEYVPAPTSYYSCGIALAPASSDGDVIPMLVIRTLVRA